MTSQSSKGCIDDLSRCAPVIVIWFQSELAFCGLAANVTLVGPPLILPLREWFASVRPAVHRFESGFHTKHRCRNYQKDTSNAMSHWVSSKQGWWWMSEVDNLQVLLVQLGISLFDPKLILPVVCFSNVWWAWKEVAKVQQGSHSAETAPTRQESARFRMPGAPEMFRKIKLDGPTKYQNVKRRTQEQTVILDPIKPLKQPACLASHVF